MRCDFCYLGGEFSADGAIYLFLAETVAEITSCVMAVMCIIAYA
jgi:hypothetical protein